MSTSKMESPYSQETPQPDASAALVPQECTNDKENAAPPSPVEREHDELRQRPRDAARGARDAPPLLDAAQSDDASDALRAVAAPAKKPSWKEYKQCVLCRICDLE